MWCERPSGVAGTFSSCGDGYGRDIGHLADVRVPWHPSRPVQRAFWYPALYHAIEVGTEIRRGCELADLSQDDHGLTAEPTRGWAAGGAPCRSPGRVRLGRVYGVVN